MNYSIIRCICALVIGVLLVAWPEAAILYLVITIGVLFLVPGLFFFIRVFDSWQAGWQSFSYCRAWQPFVRIMADDYAGIFLSVS